MEKAIIVYDAQTGKQTIELIDIVDEPTIEPTPEEIQQIAKISNEDIRQMRAQAYKDRSDSLYLAWQKYLATGEDKAEQARQMWLAEVAKIDKEFPYNE